MRTSSVQYLSGNLTCKLHEDDERVFFHVRNNIVTSGHILARNLLAGDEIGGLTHFALGSGALATEKTDTSLGAELLRFPVTAVARRPGAGGSAIIEIHYVLPADVGNDQTYREAGVFNAASGGYMYARVQFPTPLVKTQGLRPSFTWEFVIR